MAGLPALILESKVTWTGCSVLWPGESTARSIWSTSSYGIQSGVRSMPCSVTRPINIISPRWCS
ncbi:MAG: hypothetical protein ACRDOB_08500, partial [Streptosporangiaceae bacterium]